MQLCYNNTRVISACVHNTRHAGTAHAWLLLCAISAHHFYSVELGNHVAVETGCVHRHQHFAPGLHICIGKAEQPTPVMPEEHVHREHQLLSGNQRSQCYVLFMHLKTRWLGCMHVTWWGVWMHVVTVYIIIKCSILGEFPPLESTILCYHYVMASWYFSHYE